MERGGESMLAQCMLSVVQAETLLASNEASSVESVERQKPLLVLLAQVATKYVESNVEGARAQVLGHFLRSCIRAFNRLSLQSRLWTREQSQQLLSLLCSIEAVLRETGSSCGSAVVDGAMEDIVNILYPILVVLDRLKEHVEQGNFNTSEEEIAELAIKAMAAVLLLSQTVTAESLQRLAAKTASIRAQMAYLLVALSKVKSRQVCFLSVSSLLPLLSLACLDTAFVRSIFPGIFSAMYRVCTSGENRGSNVWREAVLVLLRLVEIAANDRAKENARLLDFLSSTSHRSSQDSPAPSTSSSAVFAAFVSSREIPSPSATEPVGEFSSMDAFQEFRVALLQRIRDHFPVAFSTVLSNLSAKHKQVLSEALAKVLQSCHGFLGAPACEDLLLCLLHSGDPASSHSPVQLAQDTLEEMKQSNGPLFASLLSNLQDRYLSLLWQLEGLAARANDVLARQKLEELVGLGGLLQDQLHIPLLANRPRVMRTLLSLLAVDLADKQSALETSRYSYFPLQAGQSRVAWCTASYYVYRPTCLPDRTCQALLRRLVVQVASFSDLLGFCLELQQRVDKLSDRLVHPRASSPSREPVKRALHQVAAVLQAVRYASFAGRSYTFVDRTTPLAVSGDCLVCGESPASLRCSRCKQAVYCSPAHQRAHWAVHKSVCHPVAMGGAKAVVKRIRVHKAVDPHDVLHGEGLVTVSSHEQHRSFHQALALLSRQLDRLVHVGLGALSLRGSPRLPGRGEGEGERKADLSAEMVQQVLRLVAVAMQCHADVQWLYYVDTPRPASRVQDVLVLIQCAVLDNSIVQQAAKASLERIALYSGYTDLGAMLRSQMDYFVDWVCHALRSWAAPSRLSQTPQTPQTPQTSQASARPRRGGSLGGPRPMDVHAMVRFVFVACSIRLDEGDQTPVYLLQDLLREVLDVADLQSTSPRMALADVVQLVQVMHVFVLSIPLPAQRPALSGPRWKALDHWVHGPCLGDSAPGPLLSETPASPSMEAVSAVSAGAVIASSLLAFQQNVAEVFLSPPSPSPAEDKHDKHEEDNKHEEDERDPCDAPLTPPLQLLVDILSRARYLLAVDHVQVQHRVLSLLAQALVRLAGADTFLLPALHQVWTVVAHRLRLQTEAFLHRTLLQQGQGQGEEGEKGQQARPTAGRWRGHAVRPRLEVEPRDPSVASKLLLLTRQAEQTLSPSTSSSSSSSSSSSAMALHLLPALLDLVAWMGCLAPSFLTHKVRDDCLPSVLAILFALQHVYLDTPPPAPSPAQGSDYSLEAKLRLALLAFLAHLVQPPAFRRMLRPRIRTLLWLLLPLCGAAGRDSPAVARQAQQLFDRLAGDDVVFADALLETVADMHTCGQTRREGVVTQWTMLALDPQIMQAYHAAHSVVRSSARLGRAYDAGPAHLFAVCKSYRNHCTALVHRYAGDRGLTTWVQAKLDQRREGVWDVGSWSASTIEAVQNRAKI